MKIYIQSNRFQHIAAKAASLTFSSFGLETKIILVEDHKNITKHFGSYYLRKGKKVEFRDDLQSFTLLRFLIPSLANCDSPILIIDPDIFAVKDPKEILNKFIDKKKLHCTFVNNLPRTEVMLLNPTKIYWDFNKILDELFNLKLDYNDLFCLKNLNNNQITEIDKKFNSLDKINSDTILLHTTNRQTQPWKEGLNIDFQIYTSKINYIKNYLKKILGLSYNEKIIDNFYKLHPDSNVIRFVKDVFEKAYKLNYINEKEIKISLRNNYISNKFLKRLNIKI